MAGMSTSFLSPLSNEEASDLFEYLRTLVVKRREGAKRLREEAMKLDEEADQIQVKLLRATLEGCARHDQVDEGEAPSKAHGLDTTKKLRLQFSGRLNNIVYTKDSLLEYSKSGAIEIAICRGDQIITSGDLSSVEVEIVSLECGHTCKGDWTAEEFDQQIIRSGQGSKRSSVLGGEAVVQLDCGKASLGNIYFKEGSHRAGGSNFILAARVRNLTGTTRVQEALMDDCPFVVLTERSKANKKIDIPKLGDEVHGLKGIKKNGDYEKRLKEAGINTVQKFLKALNEDPEKLRCQILNINSEKNSCWKGMIGHARECDLRNYRKLKSCRLQVEKGEVTLFFDVVHNLVGAEFSDRFVAKGKFNEEEEVVVDNLLKLAYQKLDNSFDYVMKNNRPINIHASINAPVSQSVAVSSYINNAENSGTASGIDCADMLLLGTASAPEPSRDHPKELANQGEDVCLLLESLLEPYTNNPVLDHSSGGNFDLSNNAFFVENQAQGTIFAALDQSQPNTTPSLASYIWDPYRDPPGPG